VYVWCVCVYVCVCVWATANDAAKNRGQSIRAIKGDLMPKKRICPLHVCVCVRVSCCCLLLL